MIACGGGSGGSQQQSAQMQQVLITVGDDPASRIVSFSVTVESLKLIPTSGSPVAVVSSPITIELTQLAGTAFPLGSANIPQGTYKGAQITLSHPQMVMVDPATGNPVQKPLPEGPVTFTVFFNPAVTVGDTPLNIHFDVNMLGSVTIDAAGNVTFTPKVTGLVPTPAPGDLPIRRVMGTVTSVGTNSFTMTTLFGQKSITFFTSAATQFLGGISSLSQMQAGMLAVVDATLQSDGTPLALVVAAKMLPVPGVIPVGLEGIVLRVSSDLTYFQMVVQGGIGPMIAAAKPGMLMTISVNSNTVWNIDNGVDLSGLPFTPTFNASTLKPGQRVRVASIYNVMSVTAGTMMGTMPVAALLTAQKVELVQQGLFGVVSNYDSSTSQFTLTVPLDGALSTLTAVATNMPVKAVDITVYKLPATIVNGTVTNGAVVLVRGLLFNDGSYKMAATGIIVLPAVTQ
jgi:hypothetical protein